MRLFVYGSLLSGELHHRQLDGARLLGGARTAPRYTLVDLGAYPGLLDEGVTSVAGEIYEVDADRLPALDAFEGHPDEYRRMPIRLLGGESVDAYVLRRELAPSGNVIASGNWKTR
jgi:gamma-glutamylaminecyclotransferase